MQSESETADERFRKAFARLKAGRPMVLPPGTLVSQNNVAKEAGVDPSALKKARYPALIREIQTYVEIARGEAAAQRERRVQLRAKRGDLKTRVKTLESQRNFAQSQLVSAHRQVLELLHENAALKARLEDLLPRPTSLTR